MTDITETETVENGLRVLTITGGDHLTRLSAAGFRAFTDEFPRVQRRGDTLVLIGPVKEDVAS